MTRSKMSAIALALLVASPALADDLGLRPLRYGETSGWFYDGRDDDRDVPNNGYYPGNFSADPSSAWLGAAGIFADNSYRSRLPYPSQVVIGVAPNQPFCVRHRSYDPASHTYVGKDGLRHPC
jgi:hypothetical protein